MYELININGATLLLSNFKGLKSASCGIFLKIGSRFEAEKLRGISHFLEHMVFKGSKGYSYREIKRQIEGRGGALNGFTSQESTAYYANFLNKNFLLTLDILLDMVFYPRLDVNDIKKERNVILEEIKMYNDLPSSRAISILDKLIWPDNSLGEEVIGDFLTVSKINKENLIDFQEKYYKPSSIIISCAGDFPKEKIIHLLNNKIKKNNERPSLKYTAPLALKGRHVKVEGKKLEQSHLCVGFRGVSYLSPDKFVAEVINIILGANMSSRLFEEIREKRALCYEISTDIRKYKDSGAFVVHAGLDKSKIKVALFSILKELKKIKEIKVTEKELTRAKDYILGQIEMGLERPQGMMFYLAESLLSLGKIYSLEEIKTAINKINAKDIQEFSRRIFDFNNICVSCVGNIDDDTQKLIKETVSSFK